MPNKIIRSRKNDMELVDNINKNFSLSFIQIRQIMEDFRSEMIKGLAGKKSFLKMIPAYVDVPSGREKGRFISLDLGGTNFRILLLELKGKGKIVKLSERKIVLEKEYTQGKGKDLFDFIAGCLGDFVKKEGPGIQKGHQVGFTFSFPVSQTGIASGILVDWTKDFSAEGVVGRDVVFLLNEALSRQGVNNIKLAALVNDTVGTLVSRSYKEQNCDIGIILGTGTNACYREKVLNILKWKGRKIPGASMIVNIEWGNFNKIAATIYDRLLDEKSENPGQQILEKMVSGMYLSEIARLIISDFIEKGILFCGLNLSSFNSARCFKAEYMSRIEIDRTAYLSGINVLLKELGVLKSSFQDRLVIKKICNLVAKRAAYISAAVLAGVITKIDPDLSRAHIVAVDGTVYEKYPGFSKNMKFILKQIFRKKSGKIKMVLTKDGSGIGAAVIAAVAKCMSTEV